MFYLFYLTILFYICSMKSQSKTKSMTIFNLEMTIDEAMSLYHFRGQISYPDTPHNRKMMAQVVHNHLQKLHGR